MENVNPDGGGTFLAWRSGYLRNAEVLKIWIRIKEIRCDADGYSSRGFGAGGSVFWI